MQDGDNWYAYVGNDPVNRIDPKGLDGEGLEFEEMLVKAIAENDPDQVGTLIESITDTDTADAVEGAMKQAKLPKKMNFTAKKAADVGKTVKNLIEHAKNVQSDPAQYGPRAHHLQELRNFFEIIGKGLSIK